MSTIAHYDMPLIIKSAAKRVQHTAFREWLLRNQVKFQVFAIALIHRLDHLDKKHLDFIRAELLREEVKSLVDGFMTVDGYVAREAFFKSADYHHAIAVIIDDIVTSFKTANRIK